MKNYISKIPLGQNKYAYHQAPEYAEIGEKLTRTILERWQPPKIFFHMRNGGHVAALNRHKPNAFFSHLDVNRFFYQISKNKVIRSLKKIGFSYTDAIEEASYSVVRSDGKTYLPYGFTQSPILASLGLFNSSAGQVLMRAPRNVSVSVYVDDIILSCADKNSTPFLRDYTLQVIDEFANSGFPISEDKKTICQEEIQSFNVTLSHNRLEITRERMEAFFLQLADNIGNSDSLAGISNYVHSINPAQGKEIDRRIAKLSTI